MPARAVIFHSTADPDHNTTAPTGSLAGSGWQWVGVWSDFQAVPIGPRHFLAAKHVGGSVGAFFTLDSQRYRAIASFPDPESDLTVWEIDGIFPAWASLYRAATEQGRSLVVFGRGAGRGPAVIANGSIRGWQYGSQDGRLRWGQNTVAGMVSRPPLGQMLVATFDATGGPNEAHLATGDSSGPVFINDGAGWRLAGVASFVDAYFNTSATGPGFLAALTDQRGLYVGDAAGPWTLVSGANPIPSAFYATRVSSRAGWIDSVLALPPTPLLPPSITSAPASRSVVVGSSVTLAVTATGSPRLTYQWFKDATPIEGAVGASLTLGNLVLADSGSYTVTVSTLAGSVTSPPAILTVTPPVVAPSISLQPESQTVAIGASVTFSVTASGLPPPTYQWYRDGGPLSGATGATLTLPSAQAGDSGSYTVVVSSSAGAVTSAAATLAVLPPSRFVNLSVRTSIRPGEQALLLGFVARGTGDLPVVLRGIGPTLATFGVGAVLADPRLALLVGGQPRAANDDWGGSATLVSAFAAVGAFPLPAASKDAALVTGVDEGQATVQIVGATGTPGVALAEMYEAASSAGTRRLVNLSARSWVGTGDETLIAGFVLVGGAPRAVLVRGIGPALAGFGIAAPLANPRIILRSGHQILGDNDDWAGTVPLTEAFGRAGAFALTGTSRDAALLASLPPGAYTVQLEGVGSTTGVGLIEVYELP